MYANKLHRYNEALSGLARASQQMGADQPQREIVMLFQPGTLKQQPLLQRVKRKSCPLLIPISDKERTNAEE